MSSEDEDYKADRNTSRMKRRGRACDLCRHKKVRCDGQLGEKCSNCVAVQQECTYVKEAKKRYPDAERIKALETEVTNYKKLLNKLHPGVDFSRELSGILDENSLWLLDNKAGGGSKQSPMSLPTPTSLASPASNGDAYESSDDEMQTDFELNRSMSALTVHSEFPRYLGKSSRLRFFKQAFDMRNSYAGIESPRGGSLFNERLKMSLKRNKYLRDQSWILPSLEPVPLPKYALPPNDLMKDLVDLYFNKMNILMPLLHRPTFHSCMFGALHFEDEGFATLLLLVCANGARFSQDTRVLSEGTSSWHSAGWKWFVQVQSTRQGVNLRAPRLYDIQIPSLIQMYLHGSCMNHPSWAQIGLGIRIAQDMGAHRRKTYGSTPTVEGELMKRAFWVLIMLDRSLSFSLGRNCCMEDEDMDVEFPAECDDEYWAHPDPEQAFKQPADKPSVLAFFNCCLKLKQIHAFALRTLYSTKKSRIRQGDVGPEWEQQIVSEMDSALNKWIDSVPDHLRWDPHKDNKLFLMQSACLYSAYYSTQINIHRNFIPLPQKPSALSFPSLAICTNAARSCIHVLDVQFRQNKLAFLNLAGLFSSSIVLLLNIWGGKKAGTSINPAKEMAEVHKAMAILKNFEQRWYAPGKYWEVLYDLANVGDLPLPEPTPSQKRQRGDDTSPVQSSPVTDDSCFVNGQRTIAGSKRVSTYQASTPTESPPTSDAPAFSPSMDFVLPIHSDELGRIPIFSAQQQHVQPQLTSVPDNAWNQFDMSPSVFGSGDPNITDITPLPSLSATFPGPLPQGLSGASSETQYHGAGLPTYNQIAHALNQTNPGLGCTGSAFSLPITRNGSEDTLSMWQTAPEGFEWDEWGMFISSMNVPTNDGC